MYAVMQVTPAMDTGGVERTTIEIAAALARAGGRAVVASAGGRLESELEHAGAELIRLPMASKNPLTIWANAGRLAAAAEARSIEIIHARSRAPAWSAFWAAKRLKLPFVTTYHGIYNARSALKRAYNAIMARGDLVIANSSYTRAHILREHGLREDKVVTIPRGADLERFDPKRVTPARLEAMRLHFRMGEDRRPVVLVPARLTPWKGQMLAVDAAQILLAKSPQAALIIIAGDPQGRDDYAAALDARIQELGLRESVRLAGHITDMPAALALAEVAVFPTLEPEAFGRGAIEAQAMGVPVVAAAHGGYLETVEGNQTGLLAPPGDATALAAALEQILSAPAEARREMGARGAARARAHYSTEALQRATLEVYARLIEGHRAR